ncbi:tetratricopeptide repeat protein (macronuclear) [Tetrahymena thermophila SB210]|uniref:Tetratricopeptide repeat protein n=1 Tax=Tetrahymena thermophila (strain SB210) TaxID=312017 RepID=I7MHP7_TETTS|nr:tetratricopeptide repeat protein [Tetrahymena thermophila SB210]EAS03171.2 tetratricopeptide repeat protein [Tetrahymena thermophila SB210]|eukprot:XP_001023416.2 tetratricopeptide repeat protein [Tetrahymena thermophila SB210]
MNTAILDNSYSNTGNIGNRNEDNSKIFYHQQNNNDKIQQQYLYDQNAIQARQNYQQSDQSPLKRSNSKPPLSGNKYSDNKSKIQGQGKANSSLANIQQRDEDSEERTHQNSNILNKQPNHNHSHQHNVLDISKNDKKKNFQERMIHERIKAAEKTFVVGRIKADDQRLQRRQTKNKTELSVDENTDNIEQTDNNNRQQSASNLRSTKGSNMTANIDKKDERNNKKTLNQAKSLNKSGTLKSGPEKKQNNSENKGQIPSSSNQTQMPQSSSQTKIPLSSNMKKQSAPYFKDQQENNNSISPFPESVNTNSNSRNQNQQNQSKVQQSISDNSPNAQNSDEREEYFEYPTSQNQDSEQSKNLSNNLISNHQSQHPSQNKRVQLPQQDGDQSNTSKLDSDNNRFTGQNFNKNDSPSRSPVSKNHRRQVRSLSSKGLSNKSSDKLNKSINNKTNLPHINSRILTQPDKDDSDSNSDSFNGISKINPNSKKQRSSQSFVNIHEKRLIEQGLKLKKLNNMDLIISKITKTHNQRGNPYNDPLTQQIFTKQFTEAFVKKLEKQRKTHKKTDFDYVDAAKVYYSVCDGSKLSRPEIGRGQKYLLDAANQQGQQQAKRDKSEKKNGTQILQAQPSQITLHNNNSISNPQMTQQGFNTFQVNPSQSIPNLVQSESSPNITHYHHQRPNNDADATQQSFRTKNQLSPQKKFQPLFIGARNNNQAPIYFNIGGVGGSLNGSDILSSIYPLSTSSTHSFYPHSHFHRLNPFQGMSQMPTQRERSPFNNHENKETNYGQPTNYQQQELMSPDRGSQNLDYQPSSIINNTNHFFNPSIDFPQSNMYNNNNNNNNTSNNNNINNTQYSSSNIQDKSKNPTQFTSTGKLILPKLSLNQTNSSNMDPDLQKAVQCSKILQYLNESELPNNKKKKSQIDPAEREKARDRLLGNKDKANQPKSIRQQKEEERRRLDDEKFNGPSKKVKGADNNSISNDASVLPHTAVGTVDNSMFAEAPKQIQMKKVEEEYQNFIISYNQNYNDTVSVVLKRGYPEDNEQSLLKVDQLSKDNFKNFQWKFDEVWTPLTSDQNSQRLRVLKGKDEKIKQKCSFHFFNCSDLSSHKDYLKDVSIAYMVNLHYEKDRVRNPTLLMYSIPNIFQQSKKEVEFVTQQEYYSTLECILEYRYQIRQEWEEEEMVSIFYSLLDCMNELFSLNICHGNITPAHIAYSYKTNRYKIFNFSAAQISHKDYKGGYPIYYQWPFLAPEIKKGLNYNNSKSNKYDILAGDMYSLGMSFLMIKYLIPENMRSQEAINRLISTVESDNRLSAQIIKSLLFKQQSKRLENTYATLCNHIHTVMKQKNQEFTPYQKQDLVNLNPLHKLKWKQSKDSEVIADFYFRIFQWQNAADRQKKLLDELLQIEHEGGDGSLTNAQKEKKRKILRDVWKSYFKQQEYDNAIKYNQLYMELLSQTPEEKMKNKEFLEDLAEDLKMTGQLYFTVQQPEKSIHFYDKTIQVLTELYGANHSEVVSMLNNIGVLYKSLANYTKSLEYFQQAQLIMEFTRSTDDDLYFFIRYNIAIIYFEQDDLTQAENILFDIYKVKTTEHKVKSVEVSQYAYVLGNVYIKKNHLPKAQQVIEKAIKMRESCIGYDGELIKWKQLLANICFQLGQRKEAMDILLKTVSDVKKLRKQPQNKTSDNDDATYNAIEDIGNMILETGNKKEALQFYYEALQLAKNQQQKQTSIIGALEKKIKEVKK